MHAGIHALDDRWLTLRLVAVFAVGCAVAAGLTWFNFVLIESTEQHLDESKRVQVLDFVRVVRDEVSERRARRPERPLDTSAPPAPPTPQAAASEGMDAGAIAVTDMPVASDTVVDDFTTTLGGSGDGEYLPIVKVAPAYPVRALSRRLEGHCMVEYTVTERGTVEAVRVVEDACEDAIFRDVSIEAARRFKYKPRVVDGVPIKVPGVRNEFLFRLDDES